KKVVKGEALFPRIDAKAEAALLEKLGVKPAEPAAPKDEAPKAKLADEPSKLAEPEGGYITFDDFAKVDLRLGLVRSAEPVPKSDKLLRLKVDLGEAEPRQILAGIRQRYAPEAMV